jgi:hypothetical protein
MSFEMSTILISDDVVHFLIVGLSIAVLAVSIQAYRRKVNTRYELLSIAFLFLFLSQFITLIESLFYSDQLIMIPYLEIHLTHLLDLCMLITFGIALFRRWD